MSMITYRLPFSTMPRYTDDVMDVVALLNNLLARIHLEMSALAITYDCQSSGGRVLAAEEYKSESCTTINQLSGRQEGLLRTATIVVLALAMPNTIHQGPQQFR